jgi:hypothetical protein
MRPTKSYHCWLGWYDSALHLCWPTANRKLERFAASCKFNECEVFLKLCSSISIRINLAKRWIRGDGYCMLWWFLFLMLFLNLSLSIFLLLWTVPEFACWSRSLRWKVSKRSIKIRRGKPTWFSSSRFRFGCVCFSSLGHGCHQILFAIGFFEIWRLNC